MEPIPFELAIACVVICSGLALFIGLCLRPAPPLSEDFKTIALDALKQLDERDAPRQVEWSPAVRRRIWLQEQERNHG